MGSEFDNTRRSRRLGVRLETLRTGVTPYQRFFSSPARNKCTVKTVSSNSRFSSFKSYPIDIQALENIDALAINQDIYIERAPLITDKSYTMAGVETRVNNMETDVNTLKTDVTSLKTDVESMKTDVESMNGKLDDLIESMARVATGALQPANSPSPTHQHGAGAHSATHQRNNASTQYSYGSGRDTPHQRTARHLSPEDFLQREMDRDRFEYATTGKFLYGSDLSSSRVLHKPYMYLYREGISTIKQKLEARQTISLNEYIDAMLALLADNRAYHRDDYIDMMDHLRKVTRDALERPWHAVRRWTQYVWDSIEAGAFTWADREVIQEERVRMCLTAATVNMNSSNNNTPYSQPNVHRRPQGAQEVVCRQYNTRNGCYSKESHMDGHVFALHVGTYCDSIGRTCGHSVRECERRLAHTRNDHPAHQGRSRYPQSNQYNAPYQQPTSFQPSAKNGY